MAESREISSRNSEAAFLSPGEIDTEQAERALALLGAIVASSEDAIVSKTLTGVVTSWNAAAERLFGFTASEMIGESITRVIPEELLHEEVEILRKLRRGERIERYETTRINKSGQRLDISLTIFPLRDSRGSILGAAKIAHDVTARRQAERRLADREAQLANLLTEREFFLESERAARSEAERLGRMKDEFLATLSHELRTPLNAIQGWATLLRQPQVSAQDRSRGLEIIERNVRVQGEIINDLLDMSRIISGKMDLEVQSVFLHEVVEASIESVRPSALGKGIRIQSVLDTRIGIVRGDPNRLQQVLWNLLSNAVKFTPKDGRIRIVLQRVNSHAEISVEDNGIGIAPEFLPHVFERFRQADSSSTRRQGGLGIGLSLVKTLVEMHGGYVKADSAGVDAGSVFTVDLPIAHVRGSHQSPDAADDEQARVTPGGLDLPRLDDVRVLIVDDEADGRDLIARVLTERGAAPLCASSASEALTLIGREPIDILLSDIGMPAVDGLELIHRVRALDETRSSPLPAIAITAYARTQDRQRALLAGFHMHLSKPIETRELVASIAGLLHLSR